MTIRNLDSLLEPASVAVVGASDRPDSVGATVWRNLRAGFRGPLYALNLRLASLDGEPVYARVADLPAAPELAIVCTPAAGVPGLIAELAQRGTRAAVVLSAGLTPEHKQAMLAAARPALLRVLGPNCIGALSPHIGLNASFAHVDALPGELAFVSQSGALVTAMLDWARGRGLGFSHFVSLGEQADVDIGDLLDYLALDAKTRSILLYVESLQAARKFMSAARAASRNKPVIVVKAGRSEQGRKAAASHTGALAGSDAVFDAALQRAGMLRVDSLQELFLAAETLVRFRGNRATALTILTNGGGAGVMAADAAAAAGVPLAALPGAVMARLDAVLPPHWSRGNPLDIIGDAPVQRYVDALRALEPQPGEADGQAQALLFIHAPTAIVPSADIARAVVPLAQAQRPPRMLGCWLGDAAVAQARALFRDAGLAQYDTPEQAVRAFAMHLAWQRAQAQLLQAPSATGDMPRIDAAAARAIVERALAEDRELLGEPEAKALLAACGIPVVATREVPAEPAQAVAAAREIGFPVVLKIVSPQLTHKSDVGGVVLGLGDEAAVDGAAREMLARLARLRPAARLDGFSVQAMVRHDEAHELIAGASIDPVFGPVLLFGQGGTAVELVADSALALPPLNEPLARALVDRTRVARLLDGYRGRPAVDRSALHGVLVALSQLLAELPEVAELDINPLLAHEGGVVALDARVRLSAARPGGAARFAITPYPAELVERIDWGGRALTLRPIRPEDEAQHLAFLQRLDPEDVRMRVFHSRRHIERSELARLTQIDYAREMAFVAVAPGPDGAEETLAVVRAIVDPDNQEAEFGIVVRSDLKGGGLGERLMRKLIDHLRARGTQRLVAQVLDENLRMRDLARELGFEDRPGPPGDGTRLIVLSL